jgi:hypothetical protein
LRRDFVLEAGLWGVPPIQDRPDTIELFFVGQAVIVLDGAEVSAQVGEFLGGRSGGVVVKVGLRQLEAGAADVNGLAGEEELDEGQDGLQIAGFIGDEVEGGFGGEFYEGRAQAGGAHGQLVQLEGGDLGIDEVFGLPLEGAAAAEAADAGGGGLEAELAAEALDGFGVAEVFVEQPGFEGFALLGCELVPGGIAAHFAHIHDGLVIHGGYCITMLYNMSRAIFTFFAAIETKEAVIN